MRLTLFISVVCGFMLLTLGACQQNNGLSGANSGNILSTQLDSMSYALGANINRQFQTQGITINGDMLVQGYDDGMNGAGMPVEEVFEVNGRMQQLIQEREGKPFSAEDPAPPIADTLAYSLGCDLSRQMKDFDIKLSSEALRSGAQTGLGSADSRMTEADINAQMGAFQQLFMEKQQQKINKDMVKNAEAGTAFLEEKANEEGVMKTESGLCYEILRAAEGPKPPAADTKVRVHYEGRLINGDIFDSSYKRGEPTEFRLNQVIKGWTEGLQLMPVGSKFRFYIPSNLGYGERGSPPKIGPNETLIFDVELLEIQ